MGAPYRGSRKAEADPVASLVGCMIEKDGSWISSRRWSVEFSMSSALTDQGVGVKDDAKGHPRPADGNGDGKSEFDIGAYECRPDKE